MLQLTRWVGVAPGTTTFKPNGMHGAGFGFPTQAVWKPDPNSDSVKISMPPNQWVTGPTEMHINVPNYQNQFGPVPTDMELASTRPYLPLHKGWISGRDNTIFHLQGGLGTESAEDKSVKWAIAASIISAVALATTTIIAVMQYRKGR